MERTPFNSSESLRVRCPHCRKLYLVQFQDIQEAKPRFECVQCHGRFWLSLPDVDLSQEVQGLPLQVKEPLVSRRAPSGEVAAESRPTEPCPKCFKPVEIGRHECPACGVVIEKFKNALNFQEGVPPHSATLAALWRRLIADYGQEELHQEFLRACQRERGLPYAAAQYAQMLKLMPADESTGRHLREVQALAAATLMPPPAANRAPRVPRQFPRLWQLPLIGATIVIIVGMVSPMFRNMVGVGAAFAFLAFALRVQFRRH
jgi:hypothetical protein